MKLKQQGIDGKARVTPRSDRGGPAKLPLFLLASGDLTLAVVYKIDIYQFRPLPDLLG